MKKKNTQNNGRDRLEEAMAMLIQNQASFLARVSEMDRVSSERFARIEAEFDAVRRILIEHGRMLEALPQAVRDKIGFPTPQRP